MTKVTGDWLTASSSQALFNLFIEAGHELYCVGGCVRNALLGERVADIDMATDAQPEMTTKICKKAGLRVIPTGIDHGTVTVLSEDVPFEITTYRTDIDTDGRRAQVVYSKTLEEDAKRRDFTINALYASADGIIIDPVGGLPDIVNRRVRFIGDAHQRINEDFLRILRFFRFYAWYGNPTVGIDAEGLAACAEGSGGLDGLSRERIGSEMQKLLSAPDPAPAVASMAQAGILARVMPGADAGTLAPLVHFEAGLKPDWIRRAIALGGGDLKEGWRISKKEAGELAQARSDISDQVSIAKMAYHHGADHARNVSLVLAAILQQPPPSDLEDRISKATAAQFPIKSVDLMPELQGPVLGEKLRQLEELWITSNFELSREELLES